MNQKENVFKLFPNMGYWLMIFIPLIFAGFYVTYFSQLSLSLPRIMHIHFALMSCWVLMLIVQPLLIRYRKLSLHKSIGKASYLVVPLVILTTWMMMRYTYGNQLASLLGDIEASLTELTLEQGKTQIAAFISIAFVYLIWLIIFYSLAVIYRKNKSFHARFMIAASLTLIGPTVDRILFFLFGISTVIADLPVEVVGFLFIDILLLTLMIKDIRNNKSAIPFGVSLAIYFFLQVFHIYFTKNEAWGNFVYLLLH